MFGENIESIKRTGCFAIVQMSSAVQVVDCEVGDQMCIKTYYENAAMVQVYYEQLSYESLTESEAYGVENVLADFGGHLGLWMGVSVVSLVEVLVLMYDLFFIWRMERRQRQYTHQPYTPDVPVQQCACDCSNGTHARPCNDHQVYLLTDLPKKV